MHLEHPQVLTDILHFVTILAIPLHIFGTYCILIKTPKTMGSAKWLMFNFHCWCMVLDYGVTVLAVPFMLFPALGGIPFGILKDFGCPVEIQAYLILVSLALVSASVVTIFENRYFIVFAENTKWRHYRFLLSFFNYFFASTWCLPAFFLVPDQKMAIKATLELLGDVPDYIRYSNMYVMSLDLRTITLPCFLIIALLVPQAFVFIILIRRGMKKLKKTARFSESTLKMQRSFLNAIYIQVSVYMTSIQVPIVYYFISILFKIYNQSANNTGFVIFSFNGLSSTIVMIAIHKPYRDFCYKLFRLDKFRKLIVKVYSHGTISFVSPNVN